jgi:hypothetical protein
MRRPFACALALCCLARGSSSQVAQPPVPKYYRVYVDRIQVIDTNDSFLNGRKDEIFIYSQRPSSEVSLGSLGRGMHRINKQIDYFDNTAGAPAVQRRVYTVYDLDDTSNGDNIGTFGLRFFHDRNAFRSYRSGHTPARSVPGTSAEGMYHLRANGGEYKLWLRIAPSNSHMDRTPLPWERGRRRR